MQTAVYVSAGLCFASFGWGMGYHFTRAGKPPAALRVTALLAVLSAGMHLFALARYPAPCPIAAVVMYSFGLCLFWWSVAVSRGKLAACGQTGIAPSCLITEGPYRFIRHPFYTSYNLVWIAGFFATGWYPLAVPIVLMAAIYERSAREEERSFAAGPLAADYREYKQRAGRYWPISIAPRLTGRSDA